MRASRALLPVLLCSSLGLADEPARARLEVGKPAERITRTGPPDVLEFLLPANGFARIRVDQKSAGVAVAIMDPDGRELDWTDETGAFDAEFISVLVDKAGAYRLELRNPAPAGEENTAPLV